MVVIDRRYAGGAVQTTADGAFTPTVPGPGGTFTVAADDGYPATGKFPVKINRGLSDEEHILIDSRSGLTFTVGQRGYDGTTAQAHGAGASVEIYFDAQSANLMVDHVDDTEVDPHSTKLLNNTRHAAISHTLAMMAADSVGNAQLTNNAVGTAEIADNAVTNPKLADNAVTAAEIAANAVTTVKILDDAVTAAKAADGIIDAIAKLTSAMQESLRNPVGEITGFAGAAAPSGWLMCNGAEVSRATFAALYAVTGDAYGAGNGTTTFNLPDLRQRVPMGVAASGTGSTRGGTGGTIDHTHGLDTTSSHARINLDVGAGVERIQRKAVLSNYDSNISASQTNVSATVSNGFGAALGGETDADNPPFQAINFIIKT